VDDARGASTRFRVLAHLEALRAAGLEVVVRAPFGVRAPGALRRTCRLLDLLRDSLGPARADLLLLHRKTYPPPFAGWLHRQGLPIVFDFDDALYLPHPGARRAAADPARFSRNFAATLEISSLAMCGNAELARHAGHTPHVVIATPVDCTRFAPEALPPPRPATLGWVGHSDNLPDLEALAGPLGELSRRHAGLRLVVVSDRPPRLPGLPVEFRRWSLETEVSCFAGIAVGLAPLADTAWTRAKCAYRLLQYMALGIPAVAAPVGMTREVVADSENALLASSGEEWAGALDALLRDPALGCRLAASARRTVLEGYSLEVLSPRLVATLEGVLARRET
jgi:glycosyltransferase involved in cell wall biosynthesis